MKLDSTPVKDLFVIHRPIRRDERGSFTRLFGADEIAAAGRPTNAVHVNTSTSAEVGTLRGIHFQYPPYAEAKIVACTAGAIWDVGVDLRPGSPTRFQWFGTLLTPENGLSMVIPEGFGHAFITMEPNSTAVYVVSAVYAPQLESGLRFDDPGLAIQWPLTPNVISEKDRGWGLLEHRIPELDKGFEQL
ncbi:dTDP-4-dehydrorhamnose 3,5-epimerase family protein [Limnospira fusiformis]|uniref:dTDP-4-dehydrorhamnose 3,5-epimerase family protein n=1 Tax=Limnospira fusiformis TaxID=54297 RepID=UPI00144935AB|nr:dTDP-4-keto-6-deoxy-D-glucose epimerase [Limnospira fusiformis SAG 85.79]